MTTGLIVLLKKRIVNKGFSYVIAEALKYSLEELGISTKIVSDEEGGKANLVFALWSSSISLDKFEYDHSIHVTSENLPYYEGAHHWVQTMWEEKRPQLKKFDYLFEHSSQQVEFLKAQGFNVVHFPWGYTPTLDAWQYGHMDHSQNQIQVSFIGGRTDRRKEIIKRVKNVHWHTKKDQANESEVAARSWISLNIKNSDRGCFEAGRVVCLLLGNRSFTITEPFEDDVPFMNKKHLVIAEAKTIPRVVKYYLAHPDERIRIAERGYDFVKNHYTMTQNLKKALKEVLGGSDA